MTASFPCHEPAPRVACVNLSAAEIAAVVRHHQRLQKKNIEHHGFITMHPPPEHSAEENARALEECKNQYFAHEARLLELAAILRLQRAHGPKSKAVGGSAS